MTAPTQDNPMLLKGRVRYDGTAFGGWQIQPNAPTIQAELQRTLGLIAGEPVVIHGAGRTDAGVHALEQVFHCHWPADNPFERAPKAVSSMLAPDIQLLDLVPAPPGFHARFSAVGKTYGYTFNNGGQPDPFTARYAWNVPSAADLDLLRNLCHRLQGTHDFSGYQCSKAAVVEDTVRTLHSVTLREGAIIGPRDTRGTWHLVFHGNGFLYKMVRNLTGTLIDIARGRLSADSLTAKLAEPGPYHGYTAPARGLALMAVHYAEP